MKEVQREVIDEKDEKNIEAFMHLGIPKNQARILIYLLSSKKGMSKEIEQAVNLRQPEVSIGIKGLLDLELIKTRPVRKPGKGRPMLIYSLKDIKKLRELLEHNADVKIKKLEKNLLAIRDILPG